MLNNESSDMNSNNAYASIESVKDGIYSYMTDSLKDSDSNNTYRNDINHSIKKFLKEWRKPRILFAGQSDTGKSTLINELMGSEKMPAKWTPTTSIIVYIKHISDRPDFITDDVWVFGKKDGIIWNDTMLDDADECQDFFMAGGDFSLLEKYGIHQNEDNQSKAFSAVAFIDSDILKVCDIIDAPGSEASKEDDYLQKYSANITESTNDGKSVIRDGSRSIDILVYLSRANGFMQSEDMESLKEYLLNLKPIENRDNGLSKLCNLFVIASQAGTVEHGNMKELNLIMDTQSEKLCTKYLTNATENGSDHAKSLLYPVQSFLKKNFSSCLPERTSITGLKYNADDIRSRFFTYEVDLPRLQKKFKDDIQSLLNVLPEVLYVDFCKKILDYKCKAQQQIEKQINELIDEAWKTSHKDKFEDIRRKIMMHVSDVSYVNRIPAPYKVDFDYKNAINYADMTDGDDAIRLGHDNINEKIGADNIQNNDGTGNAHKSINAESFSELQNERELCERHCYAEDISSCFQPSILALKKKIPIDFNKPDVRIIMINDENNIRNEINNGNIRAKVLIESIHNSFNNKEDYGYCDMYLLDYRYLADNEEYRSPFFITTIDGMFCYTDNRIAFTTYEDLFSVKETVSELKIVSKNVLWYFKDGKQTTGDTSDIVFKKDGLIDVYLRNLRKGLEKIMTRRGDYILPGRSEVENIVAVHLDQIAKTNCYAEFIGNDVYYVDKIEDNLRRAIASYAPTVRDDDVLGFIDTSLFNDGSSGILFSYDGIAFEFANEDIFAKYEEIEEMVIEDGKLIFYGLFSKRNNDNDNPSINDHYFDLEELRRCIQEIRCIK